MEELEKRVLEEQQDDELIVVGIGASAGGLEALRALLPELPPQSNMAYVIAQHLDPKHRSMLTTLLARDTSMHVTEIKDQQTIQVNNTYTPILEDNKITAIQLVLRDISKRKLAEEPLQQSEATILFGTEAGY